jgi:hypothetical protein
METSFVVTTKRQTTNIQFLILYGLKQQQKRTKVGEVDVIVSVYIPWPITFYLNNIKQLTRC